MKLYLGNNTHGYQPKGPSMNPKNPPKESGIPPQPRYECWFDILAKLESIEERLTALENKRPEYVPQPTIGPTKQFCDRCEQYKEENHICFGSVK